MPISWFEYLWIGWNLLPTSIKIVLKGPSTYSILSFSVILALSTITTAQQQYFRVQPRNVKVQEGGEVMLECEVANVAGQVQWTKDGFALGNVSAFTRSPEGPWVLNFPVSITGFSSVIPGFPRYSVIGDRRHGVYNLRVSNASLEDDAEYQCQVGPSRMHKAIRANARLNVICK